mgnify:CR=1 FL=1
MPTHISTIVFTNTAKAEQLLKNLHFFQLYPHLVTPENSRFEIFLVGLQSQYFRGNKKTTEFFFISFIKKLLSLKKMKKITLLLLSNFIALLLLSQNNDISYIQQKYKEAKANIASQEKGDIPTDCYTFELNQNLPAIGPQTITYKLYFKLEEISDIDSVFPYQQTLFFATRQYNIAASLFAYEEYLFDNNKLIFVFVNEKSETCVQKRFYFKNETPFLTKISKFNDIDCKELQEEAKYDSKKIPQEEKQTIEEKKAVSYLILSVFNTFKAY